MYRLLVKVGKDWRLGIKVYKTEEEALARKAKMESVGHKVKVEKTGW